VQRNPERAFWCPEDRWARRRLARRNPRQTTMIRDEPPQSSTGTWGLVGQGSRPVSLCPLSLLRHVPFQTPQTQALGASGLFSKTQVFEASGQLHDLRRGRGSPSRPSGRCPIDVVLLQHCARLSPAYPGLPRQWNEGRDIALFPCVRAKMELIPVLVSPHRDRRRPALPNRGAGLN
jgi:hypothetical protein